MTDKKYTICIESLTLRVEDEDGNPRVDGNGDVKEFFTTKRNRSDNQLVVHEEIDRVLEALTLEDIVDATRPEEKNDE